MEGSEEREKVATFGMGCFWDAEAAFRHREGVLATRVGFMGGSVPDPSYEDVSTGTTGHTEVVQVLYDPTRISYEDLLAIFWESHDPTSPEGQGDYQGFQYRSIIFFHDPQQKASAALSRDRLASSGRYGVSHLVTAIEPASQFYPAEEYHQQFYEKCGGGLSAHPQYNE